MAKTWKEQQIEVLIDLGDSVVDAELWTSQVLNRLESGQSPDKVTFPVDLLAQVDPEAVMDARILWYASSTTPTRFKRLLDARILGELQEWDEEAHPRVEAGAPEGGQWTNAGWKSGFYDSNFGTESDENRTLLYREIMTAAFGEPSNWPRGSDQDPDLLDEYNLAEIARQTESRANLKKSVGKNLSEDTSIETFFVRDLVDSWAGSSGDNSLVSVAVQNAASKVIGVDPGKYDDRFLDTLKSQAAVFPNILKNVTESDLENYVQTVYNHTQRELQRAGIDTVRLYRGMQWFYPGEIPEELGRAVVGDIVTHLSNPLTSWSLSKPVAQWFNEGRYGLVLQIDVPASRIWSLPTTGPGCLSELEVVLVGGVEDVAGVVSSTEVGHSLLGEYDPNQPRAPKGNSDGGQWIPAGAVDLGTLGERIASGELDPSKVVLNRKYTTKDHDPAMVEYCNKVWDAVEQKMRDDGADTETVRVVQAGLNEMLGNNSRPAGKVPYLALAVADGMSLDEVGEIARQEIGSRIKDPDKRDLVEEYLKREGNVPEEELLSRVWTLSPYRTTKLFADASENDRRFFMENDFDRAVSGLKNMYLDPYRTMMSDVSNSEIQKHYKTVRAASQSMFDRIYPKGVTLYRGVHDMPPHSYIEKDAWYHPVKTIYDGFKSGASSVRFAADLATAWSTDKRVARSFSARHPEVTGKAVFQRTGVTSKDISFFWPVTNARLGWSIDTKEVWLRSDGSMTVNKEDVTIIKAEGM